MNEKEWLIKNNFNPDTKQTFILTGGNSYEKREYFKELGFTFNPLLKWHIDHYLIVPDPFSLVPIDFNKIYAWDTFKQDFLPVEGAAAHIQQYHNIYSDYFLYKNASFIDMEATFIHTYNYGQKMLYVFAIGNYKINWITKQKYVLAPGQKVLLSGVIEKYGQYKEQKITYIKDGRIK